MNLFLAQPVDGVRTERPSDLLKGSDFIPVSLRDGGFRVVQRASVAVLSVRADVESGGELSAEDLAAGYAKKIDVEVRARGGLSIRGTVVYLLPEGQQRLQDVMNQSDPLLVVRDGDLVHLVAKNQIIDVRSL